MPTTDEDLDAKRKRVADLRDKVTAAEQKRLERESVLSDDITAAQLDAEAARLEAILAAEQDAGKVASVKEGASAPLEAAKEQMKQAEAQAKAQAAAQEAGN